MHQLVVIAQIDSCAWIPPSKPGDIVWVKNEQALRHLLENNLCRFPNEADAARFAPAVRAGAWPSEAKPFGPSEVKSAGDSPRPKRSGEAMAGRTIASPSSSQPGAAKLSSASAGALLPPQRI